MPTGPVRIDIRRATFYLRNSEVYREANIKMNLHDLETMVVETCNKLDDPLVVDVNGNDNDAEDNFTNRGNTKVNKVRRRPVNNLHTSYVTLTS